MCGCVLGVNNSNEICDHDYMYITIVNYYQTYNICLSAIIRLVVCVCACVRAYVCVSALRLLITSDTIWTPYDWLNKFYSRYMANVVHIINGRGLGILTIRESTLACRKLLYARR